MAAAVWFFVLRDQTPSQDEFVAATTRYVDTGQSLLSAIDDAHTYIQLDDAATAVRVSAATMNQQIAVLQRIVGNSVGRRADVAHAAITSAQNGITAQADLYSAVHAGRITSADDARGRFTAALTEVRQAAKDWEKT